MKGTQIDVGFYDKKKGYSKENIFLSQIYRGQPTETEKRNRRVGAYNLNIFGTERKPRFRKKKIMESRLQKEVELN